MNLIIIVILVFVLLGGGWGWHSSGYVGGPYLGGGVGLIPGDLAGAWARRRVLTDRDAFLAILLGCALFVAFGLATIGEKR